MPTNFPASLDDDSSLIAVIDNTTPIVAAHHNNLKDAIKAIEAKIGITSPIVATSLDYRLGHPTLGHLHNAASGQGPVLTHASLLGANSPTAHGTLYQLATAYGQPSGYAALNASRYVYPSQLGASAIATLQAYLAGDQVWRALHPTLWGFPSYAATSGLFPAADGFWRAGGGGGGGSGGVPSGFIGARAYNSTTQSISNNTPTALVFDTEEFDSNTFHDNVTNNTRFTVGTGLGGKYDLKACVTFASNATNSRWIWFKKNGTTDIIGSTNNDGVHAGIIALISTVTVDLVAGDYVEAMVLQDSGGSLNTGNAGAVYYSNSMSVSRASNPVIGSTRQTITRTSGDITITQNQLTVAEVSSALRLTIPAIVGDVLEIILNAIAMGGTNGELNLDSATVVSGSLTNQCSPGARPQGHGWAPNVTAFFGGVVQYVVQAGDIVSGNVTVTLTYQNTSTTGATHQVYADTNYALAYTVVNLGH